MSDFSLYFTFKTRLAAAAGISAVPLLDYPLNLAILACGAFAGMISLIGVSATERVRLISIYVGVAAAAWLIMWMLPGLFWAILIWLCSFAISAVLLFDGSSAPSTRDPR